MCMSRVTMPSAREAVSLSNKVSFNMVSWFRLRIMVKGSWTIPDYQQALLRTFPKVGG